VPALIICETVGSAPIRNAPAQDEVGDAAPDGWKETKAFRFILKSLLMHPLQEVRQVSEQPANTLIILLGDIKKLNELPNPLRTFLSNGGALLVATDQPTEENTALTRVLGVEVTGKAVQIDKDSAWAYRHSPDCPLVRITQAK